MSEFENALSRLDDDLHPVNYELYVYLHGVISQAIELEKQLTEANRIKDQLLIAANNWEDRYKAALQGDVIYSADYWSVREKALRGKKE